MTAWTASYSARTCTTSLGKTECFDAVYFGVLYDTIRYDTTRYDTHAQEPGANGHVFVDERVVVLPTPVQVLHQRLCQHIKRSLMSQATVQKGGGVLPRGWRQESHQFSKGPTRGLKKNAGTR